MCGIAGITGRGRERIAGMLDALRRRGPDASGSHALDSMSTTLGHVRLSIIDLDPRSNQPFVSSCGRYALTFNGEIYNYIELRARLEALGARLRTSSDTEVLLEWLVRFGTRGLAELEGMYAFCLADTLTRKLLLARDPIGEKPLYFAFPRERNAPSFAFASEIKALLALPGVDTALDGEALADYLRFLYTAAPRTLYAGIRELPPGSYLEVDVDAPIERVVTWYDLEARTSEPLDVEREEALELFRNAFASSMRLRLRSDVPLGVFLSGGMDSNAILGVAREIAPRARLDTFTVRFDGSSLSRALDESRLAARAAAAQGAANSTVQFAESGDFAASVQRIVEVFDQPFGNSTAIVGDQLAAHAVRDCKVCLVGDGGDEVLVGYPRYKALALHAALSSTPSLVRDAVLGGCHLVGQRGRLATHVRRLEAFAGSLGRPVAESFLDWSSYLDSAALARALGRDATTTFQGAMRDLFARNQADPLRAAALVDFRSFVPFNLLQAADRTSMAHALELRTPFLAPRVVETALRLPARHKVASGHVKPLLADAFPRAIPSFIAKQKKRPFNPPIQSFMRGHLAELRELLCSSQAALGGHVAPEFVAAEVAAFASGRRDNSTLLFGLATLEVWMKQRSSARAAA
jgi:asparagine synthase (glutamine-hydrolysing)